MAVLDGYLTRRESKRKEPDTATEGILEQPPKRASVLCSPAILERGSETLEGPSFALTLVSGGETESKRKEPETETEGLLQQPLVLCSSSMLERGSETLGPFFPLTMVSGGEKVMAGSHSPSTTSSGKGKAPANQAVLKSAWDTKSLYWEATGAQKMKELPRLPGEGSSSSTHRTTQWLDYQPLPCPEPRSFPVYDGEFQNSFTLKGPRLRGVVADQIVEEGGKVHLLECNGYDYLLDGYYRDEISQNRFWILYALEGVLRPSEPARHLIIGLLDGYSLYFRRYPCHGDLLNLTNYSIVLKEPANGETHGECVVTVHPPPKGSRCVVDSDERTRIKDLEDIITVIFGMILMPATTTNVVIDEEDFPVITPADMLHFSNELRNMGTTRNDMIRLARFKDHPTLWYWQRRRSYVGNITSVNDTDGFATPYQLQKYTHIESAIRSNLDPCLGTPAGNAHQQLLRQSPSRSNMTRFADWRNNINHGGHEALKNILGNPNIYGQDTTEFMRYLNNFFKHYATFMDDDGKEASSWTHMDRRKIRVYFTTAAMWENAQYAELQISKHFPMYLVQLKQIVDGLGRKIL